METGTGITMSAGCNLTQWFAWLHHGPDRRDEPRRAVPGSIPASSASSRTSNCRSWTPSRPGRRRVPDVLGIIGDWPCAVLPLEIEAGNIRALFNFGGSLLRSFPDTNALSGRAPEARAEREHRDRRQRDDAAVHARPADQGCGRAGGNSALGHAGLERVDAIHAAAGRADGRATLGLVGDLADHEAGGTAGSRLCAGRRPRAGRGRVHAREADQVCALQLRGAQGEAVCRVPAGVSRRAGWTSISSGSADGGLRTRRLLEQWHEMRGADEAALGKPKPLCLQLAPPAPQVQRAAQLPGRAGRHHPASRRRGRARDRRRAEGARPQRERRDRRSRRRWMPACARASLRSRTGTSTPTSIS